MKAAGRALFPRRGKVFGAPNVKRLANLSCLDLRKEILDSARKHVRMRAIWSQYAHEVCKRVIKPEDGTEEPEQDKFTPTDISLILAAFATARKKDGNLFNLLLETARDDIDKYYIRDFAVLYNALAKAGIQADDMINSFSSNIEAKITAKSSEKDIALLLNALLELGARDLNGIFVKASLVISSRIKYIANCHTLTMLVHSYSRFKGFNRIINLEHSGSRLTSMGGTTCLSDVTTEGEPLPEVTLITETTISLLGRCADLMMDMQATDVMYYYKSALDLVYGNSEGVTQHLYASISNLHKAHIRLREHLLEFETRELIILLDTFQKVLVTVGNLPIDTDGSLWVANSEIQNQVPQLLKEVMDELLYRTTVMSFTDCLALIKLMPMDDHRALLVYRRLVYKLKKMHELNSWEKCEKSDLWELMACLGQRSDLATSLEAQDLMVAITRTITGTLKLKDVDAMCKLAARLGSKGNALLKKVMSVHCRADYLQPTQAASMLYHLTGLGYIDHLEPIVTACLGVDRPEDALNVLVAVAILKINGLFQVPEELVDKMMRVLEMSDPLQDEASRNKMALIRVANIGQIRGYNEPYTLVPRIYASAQHVSITNVRLKANKVDVDVQILSLPQCIEDIANSLEDFVAKFDKNTHVHHMYDAGDIVVPILVEPPGSSKVAVHVLLNDFYSGRRQMLRIDVYTQMELLKQRGFRVVCCRADEYLNSDQTQFIAKLVERCHIAASSEASLEPRAPKLREKPPALASVNPLEPKLDSFSRLRLLVAGGTNGT
ncbi:hypothetical protein BaOVIS_005100 [Babesia ovis]|uniref:RAP domain-containing protein n=1 Tax=Babesia ovis TaxID=5869 RepID=A0A9W5T9A5_BABOV|nr:hypothetical protein BaOVIS_005100 [Babesia ovis]